MIQGGTLKLIDSTHLQRFLRIFLVAGLFGGLATVIAWLLLKKRESDTGLNSILDIKINE